MTAARLSRRALLAGGAALAGIGPGEAAGFDPEALLIRHGFKPDEAAWVVLDLATGALLAEKPQRILGPPASAAKLPAMLASLGVLGAEHRFETRLMGGRDEVALVGAGDPLLDSEALQTLLPALRQAGAIQRYRYDASALPELPAIDARQPLVSTYNPSVSALTLNFNRMQINWRVDARGFSASALSPSARARTPIDTVSFTQAPNETDAAILYAPTVTADGEIWQLNRKLSGTGSAALPVRNASPATAALFARLAGAGGVTLPKPTRGAPSPGATLLARHESQALVETVPLVLGYSNNLAAELIAATAARRLDPSLRDLKGAGAALAGWLRKAMPQTDWSGFVLANGSGLTTETRITARQLADIVRFGARWGAERSLDFLQLMAPVEGRNLKDGRRVILPPAWAFRAKSGTMAFSRALAGSFVTASGRAVALGLTLHDPVQRARVDGRFNPLIGGMSGTAADWLARARDFEVELARGFVGAIA
jgi:D-alanyl-D-alanine carboxypeptidase/D-alanyl-D-alanine-endopeptidase (penicillin-binding protein 4)